MKLLFKIYTFLRYYPRGRVRKVFRKSYTYPKLARPILHNKILFCPFAPHQLNIIRESIWAHACRLRGADVRMISYDLYLPAIDFISPGIKKDLKVSYRIVKQLYRIIGLPAIYLSRYLNRDNGEMFNFKSMTPSEIISLDYHGTKLGDLVIASTIRFFYCNGPEWENPDFLDKAREYAETAIILADIFDRIIDEEKPDKIVTSHGIYVSWGTLFRVARAKNIPVDVYGASYRKDTLRFYHNSPNAPFPEGEWNSFKDSDLTKEELFEVERYIKTRSSQSDDSVSLFSEKETFPGDLKNFLADSKNAGQKIFCLFTNISWDAYMFRKDSKTFDNMVEWVNENISYFSTRSDTRLIIKAHPAENYFNVPEKYRIKNCINKFPGNNILFLDELADVKPEILYKYIDAGLIYTSTVSLEMALKGIPVLTAGVGGHYSDKGFTIDPETRSDYFSLIDALNSGGLIYTPDIQMAKRYLYFRFFREALKNDLVTVVKYNIKSYNFNSLEDLLPGKNRVLDIICNGILNDTLFLN